MQRINLYHYEEVSTDVPVSLMHILITSGIFVVLLMFASVFSFYAKIKEQGDLTNFTTQEKRLGVELQSAKQKIYTEEDKQEFVNKIRLMEVERAELEKKLVTLKNMQEREVKGFSGYLNALSKYSFPGLWLTKFRFSAGGAFITLEGKTADSEFVPKLIKKLGSDQEFAGKKFETFKIIKQEKASELDDKGRTKKSSEAEINFIVGSQG